MTCVTGYLCDLLSVKELVTEPEVCHPGLFSAGTGEDEYLAQQEKQNKRNSYFRFNPDIQGSKADFRIRDSSFMIPLLLFLVV